MLKDTIRKGLVDAINEMTQLLEACKDSKQENELRIKTKQLFNQLDNVIVTTLTSGTAEFNDALKSLKELAIKARAAKDDLEKIAETINKAAEAVGKVENIAQDVLAIS